MTWSVPQDQAWYYIYVNAAFVALIENDISLKETLIDLAVLEFDTDFSKTLTNPYLWVPADQVGPIFRATAFTIATAIIYDYCYDLLMPTEKEVLLNKIQIGMDALRDFAILNNGIWYEYNNFHGLHDTGYFFGGLAIAGDDINGNVPYSWQDFDADLFILEENLFDENYGFFNYMFGDNGAYLDGNAYFTTNGGRVYLLLQAISKFKGIDYFHKPVVKNSVSRISNWLCGLMYPNRNVSSSYRTFFLLGLNDSGTRVSATYTNLLAFAEKYQDGVARWLFDELVGGVSNVPRLSNSIISGETYIIPLIVYEEYPSTSPDIETYDTYLDYKRGLIIWRTGWNNDDMQFSMESTPAYHLDVIPVHHNQADRGSITLTAYGNNFLHDPNGANSDNYDTPTRYGPMVLQMRTIILM